jgi:hypothetical protein
MATISYAPVRFVAARSGTRRATFGQRDMWDKLRVMEPHTHVVNILQVIGVPTGLTLREVLAAIGDLVLRHESLRTRFRLDARDELWQELTRSGEVPVEVWDVDRAEDQDAVREEADRTLEGTDFDLTRSWPVRVLVGLVEGAPRAVMVSMSHIAVDMLSARLVRQDLVDLLDARAHARAAPALPARRQPLDQAAFEASAAGRRANARAMASWRRRLQAAPRSMFPARPNAPREARFVRAVITSQALALAAEVIAKRAEMSTAIVLMAAEAVLLAHQGGADACALQLSVGNRITPELAWSAGNIRLHSLAVVDLRGAGFGQVVSRTWAAWIQAQRTGMYDPGEVSRQRQWIEWERGIALDLSCHFNDLRTSTQPGATLTSPDSIVAAASTTTYTCSPIPAHYAKFLLRAVDEPGSGEGRVALHAFTDTRVLPSDTLRKLMFGMERLLIWQATEPTAAQQVLDPATVAEVTGMAAPSRPAGWVRVDGSWVEVAAVEELLGAAAADLCAARPAVSVRVRRGADGGCDDRLVGYVAVAEPATAPTPAQLHRCCVGRLTSAPPYGPGWRESVAPPHVPDWLSAMAPQHYVVCADVAGMPYDEAGWLARPVIVEGSGRSAGFLP